MQVFADLTQFRVSLADFVAVVTMDNPPVNAQARVFHEQLERLRGVGYSASGGVFVAVGEKTG